MAKKIKFAVIGAGHIGKRHATMIQRNNESELVAMVDTNVALKKSIEDEFACGHKSTTKTFLVGFCRAYSEAN